MAYEYKKPCHPKVMLCFEHKGMKFYGGGWREEKEEIMNMGFEGALLIDLDDNVKSPLSVRGLKPASEKKLAGYKDPAQIKIYWPDYGTPALGLKFFNRLIDCIKSEGRDVVVFCYGGHGRTGTCLSILAGLLGVTDDPIALVRKTVCEECVESESQIKFIQTMTGLDTCHHKKPTKYSSYGYAGFGYGSDYGVNVQSNNNVAVVSNAEKVKAEFGEITEFTCNPEDMWDEDWYKSDKSQLKKKGNKYIVAGHEGYPCKVGDQYYWRDDEEVLFPLNAQEVKELKASKHITE